MLLCDCEREHERTNRRWRWAPLGAWYDHFDTLQWTFSLGTRGFDTYNDNSNNNNNNDKAEQVEENITQWAAAPIRFPLALVSFSVSFGHRCILYIFATTQSDIYLVYIYIPYIIYTYFCETFLLFSVSRMFWLHADTIQTGFWWRTGLIISSTLNVIGYSFSLVSMVFVMILMGYAGFKLF